MPPTQNPQNSNLPNSYPAPGQQGQPDQPQPVFQPPQQPAGQPYYGQPNQAPAQAGQPQAFSQSAQPATAQQPQLQPLQRPAPTGSNNDASPYDFFMQTQPGAKRKAGILGGGSSFIKIVIGGVGLLAVLGILAIVLSSNRNSNSPAVGLTAIAQQQQEIIRVSKLGEDEVQAQSLENFTATAIEVITTSQQQLLSYSSKAGGSIDEKQLDLTKNERTDTVLSSAKAANTYDTTFESTMVTLLTEYQNKVQETRDAAVTEAGRDLLDKELTSAKLLNQMLVQ